MLFLKFLLLFGAAGFLACAVGMVIYDIFLAFQLDRLLRGNELQEPNAGLGAQSTVGADVRSRGALPPSSPGCPRARRTIPGNNDRKPQRETSIATEEAQAKIFFTNDVVRSALGSESKDPSMRAAARP